mmetsp:Transcript_9667/g.14527  ORF Transcript_9667/g.14527 Transcript_9667/m.14527 type:complete len:621 (-) Transcript_9667:97-1959(-)
MSIEVLNKVQWPIQLEHQQSPRTIQCAGFAYINYALHKLGRTKLTDGEEAKSVTTVTSKKNRLNLLDEPDLTKFTYYEILNVEMSDAVGRDELKKAYHKACLTYHPDKTGRGEDDEVFMLVKLAYDTLSDEDKRRAYDSTVDFDDWIPEKPSPFDPPMSDADFYKIYGPVFKRNLRFAVTKKQQNLDKQNKRGKKGGQKSSKEVAIQPPDFGDDDMHIDQVHEFYDYWARFESWRDYSLAAAEILKHDVDSAEGRYEKRYMEKEIKKKAAAMKREENARISRLVENAMAADPRLRRYKREVALAKKRAQEEKAAKKRAKEEAEQARIALEAQLQAEKEELERTKAAAVKAEKEAKKNILRKSRQLFRKLSFQAYEHYQQSKSSCSSSWENLDEANDDIDLLCKQLSAVELDSLSDALGGSQALLSESSSSSTVNVEALTLVKESATKRREAANEEKMKQKQRLKQAREKSEIAEERKKAENAKKPWSKEEISALAKAVRKYPAGGANRWETIATFVNNLLRLETPRTKEECVAQFNAAATKAPSTATKQTNNSASAGDDDANAWSAEDDKLLQAGLAKFPASMDKNERWSSIAKGVPGKSKKECVQRFKAIREALKNSKK